MNKIEVPDWVAADVLSRYSALRIERGDSEPWPPELASQQRQEDMRAALTAALGAWVVPTACAEPWRIEYLNSYPQNSVDVSTLDTLSAGDTTLYTLRQEKPDVLP